MKRLLDIFVSGILLLMLLVPGIFVLLLLRLTGEGKVFYLQPRVGWRGKLFRVYKLVTMREGSETKGSQDITIRNDPRVLPLGSLLRKAKINELPQLYNVLNGDMSLVGWRPLVEKSFSYYPEYVQKNIIRAKPGLTGIGSIFFRDEEALMEKTDKDLRQLYIEDIAPYKGALELWYIDNRTFFMDLKILFFTIWIVLFSSSKIHRKLFPNVPQVPADGELARIYNLPSNRAKDPMQNG